jgi:hypothetical protein
MSGEKLQTLEIAEALPGFGFDQISHELMMVAADELRRLHALCDEVVWRPIETAPKDGSLILVWDGRGYGVAFWGRCGSPMNRLAWIGGHCKIDHIDQPTRWMPLPEPPK